MNYVGEVCCGQILWRIPKSTGNGHSYNADMVRITYVNGTI